MTDPTPTPDTAAPAVGAEMLWHRRTSECAPASAGSGTAALTEEPSPKVGDRVAALSAANAHESYGQTISGIVRAIYAEDDRASIYAEEYGGKRLMVFASSMEAANAEAGDGDE